MKVKTVSYNINRMMCYGQAVCMNIAWFHMPCVPE